MGIRAQSFAACALALILSGQVQAQAKDKLTELEARVKVIEAYLEIGKPMIAKVYWRPKERELYWYGGKIVWMEIGGKNGSKKKWILPDWNIMGDLKNKPLSEKQTLELWQKGDRRVIRFDYSDLKDYGPTDVILEYQPVPPLKEASR